MKTINPMLNKVIEEGVSNNPLVRLNVKRSNDITIHVVSTTA